MANKYRAVKTEVDGIVFDSKKEAGRYQELRMLERSGYITRLERQKVFDCRVNGVLVCRYRSDFAYLDKEGREIVEDVKGMKTAIYNLKAKLMIACWGIRVVET